MRPGQKWAVGGAWLPGKLHGKLETKGVNGPRKVLGAYSTSCAGEAGGISNASSVVFILPVPQRGRAQQVRWTHTGPSERPGTASSVVPLPRGVDYHLSAYETLDGDDGTGDSE